MSVEPGRTELDLQFPKSIAPAQIGAAMSKLVAASIGDIVVVLSRSPERKHYSLADIEWMILPAVFHGQFYVAEAANIETGFRAPVAVATWAFVSEEVDQRLRSDLSRRIRLRPDEETSSDIGWILAASLSLLQPAFFPHRFASVEARS